MPGDVAITLVGGASDVVGVRVDEFNYLLRGQFTSSPAQYSIKAVQGSQTLFTLPIKYLKLYDSSSAKYYFNQIFVNYKFPASYTILSFLQSNMKLQYDGRYQSTAAFTPATASIVTAEFLANDNLITYIFEDTEKKVAVITQPVTANGEFPAIPDVSTL